MSALIAGQRVLFFGPKTFNYEREIIRALEGKGAAVAYMNDKPWDSAWLKALLRLFPRLAWLKADSYYRSWIEHSAPPAIDIVLIVKGEAISPRTLRRLRSKYPHARFLLYLWDSLSNVRGTVAKLAYFDVLFSFDRDDCLNHRQFRYRPLFFLEQYRNLCSGRPPEAKCFFLGTLNGDRPRVLRRLLDALQHSAELDYWLFVRSGLELQVRKLFDRSLRSLDSLRLLRRPMTSAQIAERLATATAVIDIEHPRQAGLTMRTFEVLASGRKLITTNRRIELESFFDPQRILVIERTCPAIPDHFLRSAAAPLADDFFSRYSIDGWLEELFAGLPPAAAPPLRA
jgi:hypothetical protein